MSDTKFPYTEKVLEHFRHPRNVGQMEDADGKAVEGSPACGDMVSVHIKVDDKTKHITDVKFESYGCASNIATGSIITELAKGKTIEEARKITWKQAAEELGGLPPIKAHCSVLAVEGLRSAIQNYEEKHGIVRKKIPTSEDIVTKRLKKVMNPLVGLDLVRTKLVKEIEVKDGTVRVVIDLPATHQFATNITEEIREKIEPLWDVDKVDIEFTE
jgi:NifU-like protein involved in Fe-S cluster formation/metal-sulfur cluster biosynthetic enzyme